MEQINQIKQDRIICSAILIKNEFIEMSHSLLNVDYGIVVCGRRHCDCLEVISFLPKDMVKGYKQIQGFVTSNNYFVSRETAMIIAINSNQCIDNGREILFSEDLY